MTNGQILGERYFAGRLGDIFEFSPLRYLNGRGTLVSQDVDAIQVDWELNVGPTGKSTFVLSSDTVIMPAQMVNASDEFRHYQMRGRSSDESYEIEAADVIVPNLQFAVGTEPQRSHYFCHAHEIRLSEPDQRASHVIGSIQHLKFAGMGWTQFDHRQVADHFGIDVADRTVTYRHASDYDRLLELMKIERIDRALLATIEIPLLETESVHDAMGLLDHLEWLTSLMTENRTFSPLIRFERDGALVGVIIRDLPSYPMASGGLIDNQLIPGGLKNALESCFDRFVFLRGRVDLHHVIDMLLVVKQQKYPEFKLSGLILAFENLCTATLVAYGSPPNDDASIQTKLRSLNNQLRFMPSALLGDELRADIRNPLFHTGALVGASMQAKWEWFTRYLDLIDQIILVLLEYRGDYISPITNAPQTTPAAANAQRLT